MNLEFRVARIFLFSVSESKSSLLKTRIIFAFALYVKSSDFRICSMLSTTKRRVSVEFNRDLSWFGKEGMSINWICASSKLKVPSWGQYVVNRCGEILVSCLVRVLNIVDFPVFGNPVRTHCMSAFFIPEEVPLPDFFCFAREAFSFL